MKIIDALETLDSLKRNAYSQSEKIGWLNRVEQQVKVQIIDTHEGSEACTFTGYDDETPMSTELLAPEPFADLYLHWLAAQIDLHNGETALYNESIILYNNSFAAFERYYNRNHMPKGNKMKYF